MIRESSWSEDTFLCRNKVPESNGPMNNYFEVESIPGDIDIDDVENKMSSLGWN